MTWFKALAVFGQELMTNPRPIGAACPSSPGLARRVARMVGKSPDHYVLEIGAGTGAITAALLRDCVPAHRLIAVERSPSMVQLLRQRFDGVRVVEADACELTAALSAIKGVDPRRITHIVSSLPLRSLLPEQVEKITREFCKLMAYGPQLVQYTYNLRQGSGEVLANFRRSVSSLVWLNLPPARVEVFCAAPAPALSQRSSPKPRRPSSATPFLLASGAKAVNASPRH
ncbi:MAG: methyltransferase domain-containing protein [Verrucomicrobia bacterium]|nr:methyltransferase domain-containing protein [Verrucomicrobiota bacterium]